MSCKNKLKGVASKKCNMHLAREQIVSRACSLVECVNYNWCSLDMQMFPRYSLAHVSLQPTESLRAACTRIYLITSFIILYTVWLLRAAS